MHHRDNVIIGTAMNGWAGIDEFIAVAQAQSFTRAARKLRVSTSQVSRVIAELENRVGQRLFFRTTRHVSLTEAGERFFIRCQSLHDQRDDVLASMADEAGQLQGTIRMTCAVAWGERFVVPVLNEFMAEHSKLRVELILNNEIMDLVDEGLDLAVRFGRLPDSRLIGIRLTSRMRLLCASPGYIERRGAPSKLEEIGHHDCLNGTAEHWPFLLDGKSHNHRVHGRFACSSGYAVLDAALADLGICQLPDFYVNRFIADGRLIELLPENRPEDEPVWVVYPHRSHLPLKVKFLVEKMQKAVRDGLFR